MSQTKSAAARQGLSHLVIDSDGHWMEYEPAIAEYVESVWAPTAPGVSLQALGDLYAWRGVNRKQLAS